MCLVSNPLAFSRVESVALQRLHPSSWLCLMGQRFFDSIRPPLFSPGRICAFCFSDGSVACLEKSGKSTLFPLHSSPSISCFLSACFSRDGLAIQREVESGLWTAAFSLHSCCAFVLVGSGMDRSPHKYVRACMHACACAHIHEGTNFSNEREDSERTGHRWSRCRFVRVRVWSWLACVDCLPFLPSAYVSVAYASC